METYPNEYNAMKDMITNFLKQNLPKYYNQMVSDTEERIQELVQEKNDIESSLENEGKKLEELKAAIKERQNKLILKEIKLVEAKEKLQKRQEKLERIRTELQEL